MFLDNTCKTLPTKIIKKTYSRRREPLIVQRAQTLNTGFHVLYFLGFTPFLKDEQGKRVFNSTCFSRVYI